MIDSRIVRVRGIIADEGKYLFVQHAHDASFWALPGGKLEHGETLLEGLRRELVEELGIRPEIGRLLYVHQFTKDDHESLEFFFEVINGKDYTDVRTEDTTHGKAEIACARFIDPAQNHVMPGFLSRLTEDIMEADWPKVLVRADSPI